MTDVNGIISAMNISERRLRHTFGVADCAKTLAKTHFPSLDMKVVELAALMHDFTKEYPIEKQFELIQHYQIELTEDEKSTPKLLHGKTAAMIASDRFGLPKEACSAIYWHTTGRANMTPMETVIYLADYIEDFRDDPSCVRLREYYQKCMQKERTHSIALLKTLVRSFDTTLKHLIADEKTIDENTIKARNFYIKQLAERV